MALWVIRAGREGEREQFALDNRIATIGWERIGDLYAYISLEEIRQAIEKEHQKFSPQAIGKWAAHLKKFRDEIQLGDLVIMPSKKRNVVYIGTVVGSYRYVRENPFDQKHVLPIDWQAEYPRKMLDESLKQSLRSQGTIFQPGGESIEEYVRSLLTGNVFFLS